MEWMTLCLISPLVLVPVVFLWGYAGCGFSITLPGVDVPTNLTVTAVTGSSVSLSWQHDPADNVGVFFEIERRKDGETPLAPPFTSSTTSFTDVLLDPSTLYHYRVRAVAGMLTSAHTTEVDATTLPLAPCFSAALATDQPNLHGFCIVQRIEPTRLAAGGSRVRITVRGSTAGNLVLDRVFISQVGTTGNPYDSSATDITLVAAGVQVPANMQVPLPLTTYALNPTRPLLVSFDINPTPGNGNVRYLNPVPITEAVMYFRQATAEAGIPDRLPSAANPAGTPYNVSNSIYLIETIEVA